MIPIHINKLLRTYTANSLSFCTSLDSVLEYWCNQFITPDKYWLHGLPAECKRKIAPITMSSPNFPRQGKLVYQDGSSCSGGGVQHDIYRLDDHTFHVYTDITNYLGETEPKPKALSTISKVLDYIYSFPNFDGSMTIGFFSYLVIENKNTDIFTDNYISKDRNKQDSRIIFSKCHGVKSIINCIKKKIIYTVRMYNRYGWRC